MGKLRFGLIGCSNIAWRATLPALQSSCLAELGMVGSRSLEKARRYAERFGCDYARSYDEVLARKDVEAIYVSLPVGLNEEWVIKSAQAGKHVLCEKSATVSYASALRMVEACRGAGVRLMEGFSFRFHPQHARMRELVATGALGRLSLFTGAYGFPPLPLDNIRYRPELGGGALNDVGCYPICASRMLFQSEPLGVMASLRFDPAKGVDIQGSIYMQYPEERVAFVAFSFDNCYQSTYSLWGSQGLASLQRAYAIPKDMEATLLLRTNGESQEIKIPAVDQFRLMIEAFCNEVMGLVRSDFNFEEDLLAQARVMEAVRVSHREGRFVRLEEIQ